MCSTIFSSCLSLLHTHICMYRSSMHAHASTQAHTTSPMHTHAMLRTIAVLECYQTLSSSSVFPNLQGIHIDGMHVTTLHVSNVFDYIFIMSVAVANAHMHVESLNAHTQAHTTSSMHNCTDAHIHAMLCATAVLECYLLLLCSYNVFPHG